MPKAIRERIRAKAKTLLHASSGRCGWARTVYVQLYRPPLDAGRAKTSERRQRWQSIGTWCPLCGYTPNSTADDMVEAANEALIARPGLAGHGRHGQGARFAVGEPRTLATEATEATQIICSREGGG